VAIRVFPKPKVVGVEPGYSALRGGGTVTVRGLHFGSEISRGYWAAKYQHLTVFVGAEVHPTPYNLHPIHYTLRTTPYILHPVPYTLHPTPTPYILHPAPYALPTPNRRAAPPSTSPTRRSCASGCPQGTA